MIETETSLTKSIACQQSVICKAANCVRHLYHCQWAKIGDKQAPWYLRSLCRVF